MIQIILAIRDAKSEAFGRPFFLPTIGLAIRQFTDEVNRVAADNILNTHPEDFGLYEIGTFEDNAGTFETKMPKLLINGNEVIERDQKISKY